MYLRIILARKLLRWTISNLISGFADFDGNQQIPGTKRQHRTNSTDGAHIVQLGSQFLRLSKLEQLAPT